MFYQSELQGKTTEEIEARIKDLKIQAMNGEVKNLDLLCHELGTLIKELDKRTEAK
jgi:hypothetical protein